MANLKQRIRVLEISATGRGQNVPTLADFYASIERGEDPDTFGTGKPLSYFYGGVAFPLHSDPPSDPA